MIDTEPKDEETMMLWQTVLTLKGHTDRVWSVMWSSQGDQLESTSKSWDQTVTVTVIIRVWDHDAASGAKVSLAELKRPLCSVHEGRT